MKRTAMEGVRDAVITQLVIICIQKLRNVLPLLGSPFADAAKGVQRPSPALRLPRAGVLFFKNNWRKIVDLVTKIFNTLSAVADNDTKGVADGIEGTMGRGLQVIFGFFMTSLGLNGVVNTVINVFRKIGDFLRKAVQKGVDMVVNWVKDKFKGLFKRRGAGAQPESDPSAEEPNISNPADPGITPKDRRMHKHYVQEIVSKMESPPESANRAESYAILKKRAWGLEGQYNKLLKPGIKTTITLDPLSGTDNDGDVDFRVKIAPNTTEASGQTVIEPGMSPQPGLAREMDGLDGPLSFSELLAKVQEWRVKYHEQYTFTRRKLGDGDKTHWIVDIHKIVARSPRGSASMESPKVGHFKILRSGGEEGESISDEYFKELSRRFSNDQDKLKELAKLKTRFNELRGEEPAMTLTGLAGYVRKLNLLNHDLFSFSGGKALGLPVQNYDYLSSDGKAIMAEVDDLSAMTPPGTEPETRSIVGWEFIAGELNKEFVGTDSAGAELYKPTQRWVRMHLINENFGGHGKPNNLVPGTKHNNYLHLKAFEEKIKEFIKKDGQGKYKVAGMRGDIEYWPSGLYKMDHSAKPHEKKYHVPETFYGRGIESSMYAKKMTFTSWGKELKDGKWIRSGPMPASKLVIEVELPNWQTPKIPSTGTVTQGQLEVMANFEQLRGNEQILLSKKTATVHHILTRHNFQGEADFRNKVMALERKKAGQSTLQDLKKYGNVPTYDLTTGEGGEFDLLIKAIEKLETWGKITYL